MDIEEFSTTYWYIWFLLTFLIVILLILNGIGILLYRKKRQEFLNRPNRNNENIAMEELSTISTVNNDKTKYRPISVLSTITNNSSSSPMPNARSSYVNYPRHTIVPLPKITTIFETSEVSPEDDEEEEEEEEETTSPSNQTNNKSDMDLSLEVFQRQALKEHNAMRAMYRKPPFKLSESLNLYAQYWAEQCANMNTVTPSRIEWRLHCKGEPIGENIVSVKSMSVFDGAYFTSLIMANGNQSHEVDCVLNEITTEVGFGLAQSQATNSTTQQQWIGVAHYYPYRQLTTVQS